MTSIDNYIYLLQTREFVTSKSPIYKLGKTTKPQLTRFNQYPNGSKLIIQIECIDCNHCEKKLLAVFRSKYICKTEYGREYFEGDCISMTRDIFDFIMSDRDMDNSKCIKPVNAVVAPVKLTKNIKLKNDKLVVDIEKTDNKEYSCERCLCLFKSKTTLIKHLKNKTGCVCIESNRNRQDILDELMFRTGIKCNGCGNNYSTIYTLKRHQDSQNCRNVNDLEYLRNEIKQIHKILSKK